MNNYNNYAEINHVSRADFLTRVFTYLGIGLGLSALGALVGGFLLSRMAGVYSALVIIALISEFVLAFMMGRNLQQRSTSAVRTMFIIYSIINGFSLSVIIGAYTDASVLLAFVTTAVVFASLAIIGKTTKIDLSRFGSLFLIGLIVCIVLSLLNLLIFRASGMEIFLCYVETLLFMGIIAYDTQMIERYYANSESENYAIYAAFQLELDFVNLLIRVLQIFGKRRDD